MTVIDHQDLPLVVGAPGDDGMGTVSGAVWILARPSGTQTPSELGVRFDGDTAGDWLGYSVSGAGDVNGDGFADIAVGAPQINTEGPGYAVLLETPFVGGGSATTLSSRQWTGAEGGSQFGIAVAGWADAAGDMFVAVGASLDGRGAYRGGAVYLFDQGSPSGLADEAAFSVLVSRSEGDWFGDALSEVGDVNGDGYTDLLIGAQTDNTAGLAAGAAYLFFGPIQTSASSADADAPLLGVPQSAGQTGWAVAGGEDLDGDGRDDFLVSSISGLVDGEDISRVWVFLSPEGSSVDDAQASYIGSGTAENAGWAVVAVPDRDGDGRGEIAFSDPEELDVGRVYIAYSPHEGDVSVCDLTSAVQEDTVRADFGSALAAGDLDGDGVGDLLVGAPFEVSEDGESSGFVYLLMGGGW